MSEETESKALPPFDTLADLFVAQGALVSPAEIHGYLCGQLAAGKRYSDEGWLSAALDQLGVEELLAEGLQQALQDLREITQSQLETQGFELRLLLPDDDADISQRGEALALWCHGFMSGYTLAGGAMQKGLSEDARDALQDFTQIAQLAVDPDDPDSDSDLEEVSEYVRMGALLLFSECNRGSAEQCAPPGTALH